MNQVQRRTIKRVNQTPRAAKKRWRRLLRKVREDAEQFFGAMSQSELAAWGPLASPPDVDRERLERWRENPLPVKTPWSERGWTPEDEGRG